MIEEIGLAEGEKVICLSKGKRDAQSDIDCSVMALTVKDASVGSKGKVYVYFEECDDYYYAAYRKNVYTKEQLLEMLGDKKKND